MSGRAASRWLVTGAAGMLGRDLCAVLAADPTTEVNPYDRDRLDVTDPAAVRAAVAGHDIVVNAAAWTDVDGAEGAEAEATAVNGGGARNLAAACAATGARLLHISTDYVFAGTADQPYREDAPPDPLNAYGRSKLAGERAVAALLPRTGYTVRTAWLYDEHGGGFVGSMLKLAGRQATLDVVDDQRGQPTWTHVLAQRLAELGQAALAGRAPAGTYHGTASGSTTWYGLARAVFGLAGLDTQRIRPCSSGAFPRAAARPAFSVLGHARWADAGLAPLPHWRTSLGAAMRRPALAALVPGQPSRGE